MRRSLSISILTALPLLALPAALAAQATASTPAGARPPGCRGVTNQRMAVVAERPGGESVVFPSYDEIESVQPASPAEQAGFRIGDMVVLQDGHDLIANPPKQPRLAGDTTTFVVRRNGAEVPLTVILGRWDPPQESEGVTRVCRRVDAVASGG